MWTERLPCLRLEPQEQQPHFNALSIMEKESIDVDAFERWFLFAPIVVLIFGWLQLNLILLGYKSSILSCLLLLPLSYSITQRFAPGASSKSTSSHLVLLTLVAITVLCELLRPATSYPVHYDGAYHIVQASTYADIWILRPSVTAFSGHHYCQSCSVQRLLLMKVGHYHWF